MSTSLPVVVVGGGFGGVYAAKELLKRGERVTLVSETNFFTFTPLLHEVATGILTSDDITFEYASFFGNGRFRFVRGRAERIDFARRVVIVDGSEVPYRDVVIATGSSTNFYDLAGREQLFELKSVEDAARLKKRMIELGQGVENEVNVSVIGGGPTGVELAFEMELFLKEIRRHNPTLKFSVRVIQAAAVLLPMFPEKIQRRALLRFKRRDIDVLLGTKAVRVTPETVETDRGTFPSNLTVMAAGVTPNVGCLPENHPSLADGHVYVDVHLRVKGAEHAYALGDIIRIEGLQIPKLAQLATSQASIVAENIARSHKGVALRSYTPRVQGLLVSFGYGDGAGEVLGLSFTGVLAWYVWRTVYLFKTPGLSNKVRVAFSWTLELFQRRNMAEE